MGSEQSVLREKIVHHSSSTADTTWYDKMEELGNGHFGVVHSCRLTENKMKFAMKTVSAPKLSERNKKDLNNFIEINTHQQLDHKHIIKYYHAVADHESDRYFVYMEFAEYGSLRKLYLNYGFLLDTQVSKYTKHILKGLQYLHNKRIIHHDLKCDNVLLDCHDVAKLSDFGLANVLNESVEYLSMCGGTLYFKAPEVARGKHSFQADIWSLGATVLEMKIASPPDQIDDRMSNKATPLDSYEELLHIRISETVFSFLKLCLKTHYKERAGIETLLEHPLCKIHKVQSEAKRIDDKELRLCNSANKIAKCFLFWKMGRKNSIKAIRRRLSNWHLTSTMVQLTMSVIQPLLNSASTEEQIIKHTLYIICEHFIEDQRRTAKLNAALMDIYNAEMFSEDLGLPNILHDIYLKPSIKKADLVTFLDEQVDLFTIMLMNISQIVGMQTRVEHFLKKLLLYCFQDLKVDSCCLDVMHRFSNEYNISLFANFATKIIEFRIHKPELLIDPDYEWEELTILESEISALETFMSHIRPYLSTKNESDILFEYNSRSSSFKDIESSHGDLQMERLTERVDKLNLRIVETKKDGNCMFEAISDQIDGCLSPQQLRRQIVENLEQNPQHFGVHFKQFLNDQTWEAFLEEMKKDGTWGNQLCLIGAMRLLNRPIKIISSIGIDGDNETECRSQPNAKPILLGHIAEKHYVSLKHD